MLAVALTMLVVSSASPALPGEAAEAEQARFKALVLSGERFFGAGDYGMAIWAFRQADAIRVTPEVAYNLARSHERINDPAGASYYYRLYLRRSPEAVDALEVAEILGTLLGQAERKGLGLLEVDAPTPGTARLDGKAWAALPVAAFLPGGEYPVEVRFANGETVKRTVSVRAGRTASLRLEALPPPLLNADGSPAAVSLADGQGPGARQVLRYSSIALMGASALALAAGTVFGAMSSAEASRLGADKQSLTVSQAQGAARSAGQKGATANLLWGAGAAGLLAGGVMFVFTLPGGE